MSKAVIAAKFVRAIAKDIFPDVAKGMETNCVDWLARIDDAVDSGSHKYIPADRLSAELGQPSGAGVFGYRKYDDGSYLLLTCSAGVAIWDGGESKPRFD